MSGAYLPARPQWTHVLPAVGQVAVWANGSRHGVVHGSYGLGDGEYYEVWEHTADPAGHTMVAVPADDSAVAKGPLCNYCPKEAA